MRGAPPLFTPESYIQLFRVHDHQSADGTMQMNQKRPIDALTLNEQKKN